MTTEERDKLIQHYKTTYKKDVRFVSTIAVLLVWILIWIISDKLVLSISLAGFVLFYIKYRIEIKELLEKKLKEVDEED